MIMMVAWIFVAKRCKREAGRILWVRVELSRLHYGSYNL